MNFKESKTYRNLAKAFAGESQARIRYEFLEYGARKEGFKALSEVIDKLVYNEFNHARMFYTYLQKNSKDEITNIDIDAGYPFKQKWDLLENLRLAAEDELAEAEDIYPAFARVAEDEGYKDIAKLFEMVSKVEQQHHDILMELYEQMKSGTMYKKEKPTLWCCADCGYRAMSKEAWEECPLCKAKQGAVLLKLENDCE